MVVRITYMRSMSARLPCVMSALCDSVNAAIRMFWEYHPEAPQNAIVKIEIVDKGFGT